MTEVRGLVIDCADLMVNAGMIDSISGRWSEVTQENWQEKIREIRRMIYGQIHDIQEFASAYD